MNRVRRTYTEEQFKKAVKTSTSIHQVLIKLGVVAEGGNYREFHRALKNWPCDTSHLTGKLWSKGKIIGPKRPIMVYLANEARINSATLRKRLIREGIFKNECCVCGLSKWLGTPISLELDHINGNHEDNTLSNLRVVCPNCHAQTDNYRGRNQIRAKENREERDAKKSTGSLLEKMPKLCTCGSIMSRKSTMCRECNAHRQAKIEWPSIEELMSKLAQSNFSKLGRELGVSDNAIRKHLHGVGEGIRTPKKG